MIVKPANVPQQGQDIELVLCWLNAKKLQPGGKYALKHTTKDVRCIVKEVHFKYDINTLEKNESDQEVGMNDIARVRIRTTEPLFFDSYRKNRSTGSLILIDEFSHETVGAGMII